MHVHPRAYVCIINEKKKGNIPGEIMHVVSKVKRFIQYRMSQEDKEPCMNH